VADRRFGELTQRVLLLPTAPLSYREHALLCGFLAQAFQSLEVSPVRRRVLRLLSAPLWLAVAPSRVEAELARVAETAGSGVAQTLWRALAKASREQKALASAGGAAGEDATQRRLEAAFVPWLLRRFLQTLDDMRLQAPATAQERKRPRAAAAPPAVGADGQAEAEAEAEGEGKQPSSEEPYLDPACVRYCEVALSLFNVLLSQLATRRFLCLLLRDACLLQRCEASLLARRAPHLPSIYEAAGVEGMSSASAPAASSSSRPHYRTPGQEGRVFAQLLGATDFLLGFEVDEHAGAALAEQEVAALHTARVLALQRLVYTHLAPLPDLAADAGAGVSAEAAALSREARAFALSPVSLVTRRCLRSFVALLSDAQLLGLVKRMRLLPVEAALEAGGHAAAAAAAGQKRPRQAAPEASGKEDETAASSAAAAAAAAAAVSATDDAVLTLTPPPVAPLCVTRSFAVDLLARELSPRVSQLRAINALPLYPNEALLWDEHLVPAGNKSGPSGEEAASVLPRLGLQFLSFYDYFLRSFHLYRLESAYAIRADIVDAVLRSAPRQVQGMGRSGLAVRSTRFTGWARMAAPLDAVAVCEVAPPQVGETVPARVQADVSLDLSCLPYAVRTDWDQLRERDVLFLVTVRCPVPAGADPEADWAARKASMGHSAPLSQPGAKPRSVPPTEDFDFPAKWGVTCVRGCELAEVRDENGNVYNDPSARPEDRGKQPAGTRRSYRVLLDPAQYHSDAVAVAEGRLPELPYTSCNLLVRRRGEENNFKAVLATIRDVMNDAAASASTLTLAGGSAGASGGAQTTVLARSLPTWVQDVLLGYGDPAAAHYSSLPPAQQANDIDFKDTFMSAAHVIDSFPSARVEFGVEGSEELTPAAAVLADPSVAARFPPPYRVRFERSANGTEPASVRVLSYQPPRAGPFPEDVPKSNRVRFTPMQVEAIRSGLNPGLTMVVGPPGTGKTDTAVQIIANLYHNFPSQRILVVTHSNQALNDLFEKIMQRDVREHHLLRLGSGEKELATDKDFSKWGRVNHALARRARLLAEVDQLAVSIGVPGDVGYTCETAEYFFLHHIVSRIEQFRAAFHLPTPPESTHALADLRASGLTSALPADDKPATTDDASALESESITVRTQAAAKARIAYRSAVAAAIARQRIAADSIMKAFPFPNFFAAAPGGLERLFGNNGAEETVVAAEACFRHLEGLLSELSSYRAFELLRHQRSRTDYMLTKQARIIAMTCTHAALTRQHLIELGFRYDTVVMEEAAQVLEVETFIPLVLQRAEEGNETRLKRVVLIGDHNQLPPVVQNLTLQRHGKLDQSLFARLVRLGVPTVQLDMQGRARPSLAALYNWRYKPALGNLSNVLPSAPNAPIPAGAQPEYSRANAGFVHEVQLVDVPDYMGKGESTPLAHFYQNLGEAEYLVATYQYMRLCGYPASRITMLTTYNGQKQLLRDVVARRCCGAFSAVFGPPAKIETVDKYQGQQNDFVLLSLVRTKTVGHLRDVRRLVVATSRARLGLYIFGRAGLFSNCFELLPAFSILQRRPLRLQLLLGEQHPTTRHCAVPVADAVVASGNMLKLVDVVGVDHMMQIVTAITGAQRHVQQMQAVQPTVAATSDVAIDEEEGIRPDADTAEINDEDDE
jgi:hypothetical protein